MISSQRISAQTQDTQTTAKDDNLAMTKTTRVVHLNSFHLKNRKSDSRKKEAKS